jgi:hypothetical protein
MSKCPYCETEIYLEDFFQVEVKESKKGKIKKNIGEFKGENMSIGFRNQVRMWTCPSCGKIIGFSEYKWNIA